MRRMTKYYHPCTCHDMKKHRFASITVGFGALFLSGAVVLWLVAGETPKAATTAWSKISGTWVVTSVKVDTSGISALEQNDPAFMGTEFSIGPSDIASGRDHCVDPTITTSEQDAPLGGVIQQMFGAPGDPYYDEMSLMGFTEPTTTPVTVYVVKCASGRFDQFDTSKKVIWISSNRLAIAPWFGNSLLILTKEGQAQGK